MTITSAMMKVMLSLVRFIASNKTARLLVTLYSVLLHGLVFAVLYKLASTESCKHDMAARWHEKYIEHMQVTTVMFFSRAPLSVNHNSQYCRMFMATLTTSDNQRIILQLPRTLSK